MAARYMRRTNLMDILNEEKKNEPLQLVKKGYGIAGGIFLVVGLLFGICGATAYRQFIEIFRCRLSGMQSIS